MPMRPVLFALFTLSILFASLSPDTSAFAADAFPKNAHPVKATLMADVDAIVPGKPFSLGLHFTLKPHWHTYWIHPGDAGMATKIKLNTPGFRAGEIQWPTPHVFPLGDFKSFGYENEVLHIVQVQPPDDLQPGDTVTLNVAASWLACKEICLEGKAKLQLKLPVAKQANRVNDSLFKKWKSKRPVNADAKPASQLIKQIKQATDADGKPRNELHVAWKTDTPPKEIQWFPSTTQAISVDKIKMTHAKNVTQIAYETEVFDVDQVSDGVMRGVLVFIDGKGNRIGVLTSVRVTLPKD